jgi:uncharacterized damage-inducible protein DinB
VVGVGYALAQADEQFRKVKEKLMEETKIAAAYLEEIRRGLSGNKRLAEGAFSQVGDEDFFREIDPESNSLAIMVKHMAGSTRSRFTDFLTSDGEKPDRNRDQEFEMASSATRKELMKSWDEAWKIMLDSITALQPADLMRVVTIRGEPFTVLQALYRQVAHTAYHVGQILFLAKHLRGAQWTPLSIPRSQSEEFSRKEAERRPGPSKL